MRIVLTRSGDLKASTTVFLVQLAVVVASAGGSWWYGLSTLRGAGALQRAAHHEIHRAQEGVAELASSLRKVHAPLEGWQAGSIVDELKRVSTEVERTFRVHGLAQQRADAEELVARLASGATLVLGARDPDTRAEAQRAFTQQAAVLEQHLRALELTMLDAVGAERERCIRGLLGAIAIALMIYLATAVWLGGDVCTVVARRAASTRACAQAHAFQLESAVRGEPAPPAEIAPGFERLSVAVDAARANLERMRDTLRFERHRARFSHDLVEALELADGEAEVCATVASAADVAFPGHAFQLLLADNSHARLAAQLSAGPKRCSPQSPQSCPALRRSRTLLYLPDGGMGRCPRLAPCAESVACAAIAVRGRSVGVAQLVGSVIDQASVETLTGMSFSIGARLGVVRTLGERELAAATDALTGLANRRAMNDRLAALDQAGMSYAVISADLDHFKRLNDTYGHEVGDRCLRMFAQVLRDACRGGDLACRPGGEEFALILGDADVDGGAVVAERVHALLEDASRRAGLPFTVSLGLAVRPAHGTTAEEILRAADAALYSAKHAGRNCTRVFALAPSATLVSAA